REQPAKLGRCGCQGANRGQLASRRQRRIKSRSRRLGPPGIRQHFELRKAANVTSRAQFTVEHADCHRRHIVTAGQVKRRPKREKSDETASSTRSSAAAIGSAASGSASTVL